MMGVEMARRPEMDLERPKRRARCQGTVMPRQNSPATMRERVRPVTMKMRSIGTTIRGVQMGYSCRVLRGVV